MPHHPPQCIFHRAAPSSRRRAKPGILKQHCGVSAKASVRAARWASSSRIKSSARSWSIEGFVVEAFSAGHAHYIPGVEWGPEGNIQLWVRRAVHCSSAPSFLICSIRPFFFCPSSHLRFPDIFAKVPSENLFFSCSSDHLRFLDVVVTVPSDILSKLRLGNRGLAS